VNALMLNALMLNALVTLALNRARRRVLGESCNDATG
jgi:hypothetical protein